MCSTSSRVERRRQSSRDASTRTHALRRRQAGRGAMLYSRRCAAGRPRHAVGLSPRGRRRDRRHARRRARRGRPRRRHLSRQSQVRLETRVDARLGGHCRRDRHGRAVRHPAHRRRRISHLPPPSPCSRQPREPAPGISGLASIDPTADARTGGLGRRLRRHRRPRLDRRARDHPSPRRHRRRRGDRRRLRPARARLDPRGRRARRARGRCRTRP